MPKDAIFEAEREVRTFVDLSHGADVLIMTAETIQEGSYYTTMSALLLTAFTFEAYLNHLGSMKVKFWDRIESIRTMDKYMVLCEELEIVPDFSKRPYQTIGALFKFRNAIAHGKSQILTESKSVGPGDDPYMHEPKTHWEEYCNLANAKRAKEDVEAVIKELHAAAGLGNYPFIHGITVSSITTTSGPA